LDAYTDKLSNLSERIGNPTKETPEAVYSELSVQIENALNASQGESWWQTFLKKNIAKILQGYVRCFPKINVGIETTKYLDFLLETQDGYLDVLEIKKPDAPLLRKDRSHENYCLGQGMPEAISQIEHYLKNIQEHSFELRSFLQENTILMQEL